MTGHIPARTCFNGTNRLILIPNYATIIGRVTSGGRLIESSDSEKNRVIGYAKEEDLSRFTYRAIVRSRERNRLPISPTICPRLHLDLEASYRPVSDFSGSMEFLLPTHRHRPLSFFPDCLSNLLFHRIVFRCFFFLSLSLS